MSLALKNSRKDRLIFIKVQLLQVQTVAQNSHLSVCLLLSVSSIHVKVLKDTQLPVTLLSCDRVVFSGYVMKIRTIFSGYIMKIRVIFSRCIMRIRAILL